MILIFTMRKGLYIMKKRFLLVLICVFSALLMCACTSDTTSDDGKINIVCTEFPQYDWTKSIVQDSENVNLILLNTKGTDMHSFEPSADDIIKVAESDILILIGGEGDKWALDAVSDNKKTTVINLLDLLKENEEHGVLAEHDHIASCDHSHEDAHESADEHVWMSIKNADFFIRKICEVLYEKDPQNAGFYKGSQKEIIGQLGELDYDFSQAIGEYEHPVIVVADRFPFKYLTDEYGIECFAAFPGCSADTDASPDTIIKLSKAVDEHNLKYIAVTENTSGKTAQAVINNTGNKNQQTVVIDSMQSVSLKDIENGATYIGIMKQNFEAMKKLLEKE